MIKRSIDRYSMLVLVQTKTILVVIAQCIHRRPASVEVNSTKRICTRTIMRRTSRLRYAMQTQIYTYAYRIFSLYLEMGYSLMPHFTCYAIFTDCKHNKICTGFFSLSLSFQNDFVVP